MNGNLLVRCGRGLRNVLLGAALVTASCATPYRNAAIGAAVSADAVVDQRAEEFRREQLGRLKFCMGAEAASGETWPRHEQVECMGEYASSGEIVALIEAVIVAQRAIKLAYDAEVTSVTEWIDLAADLEQAVSRLKRAYGGPGD